MNTSTDCSARRFFISSGRQGFRGKEVVEPFLKKMRDKVKLVVYSLPGKKQPVHAKLY